MQHHCVTFNFGLAKVSLPAIFETFSSYDKDMWTAATAIAAVLQVINFTASSLLVY